MSKRLVIAVDCDDVLMPTAERIVTAYNRDYGTHLQLEHFYSPATLDTWGTDNDQVAIERVGRFLRSSEFAGLEPYPEAILAIQKFAANHELHLVTGRPDYLEPVTRKTLDQYFPGCFMSVEHTSYYEGKNKRSKGEVCAKLNADVLVDDHIAHGMSVLESGLQAVIVFGQYAWNQGNILPGMTRCADWLFVESEIDRIALGRWNIADTAVEEVHARRSPL